MLRNSILNGRHIALGSKLDGVKWNDMPIPWSYGTDPHDEVIAVRSRTGLYDVSAVNIIHVVGSKGSCKARVAQTPFYDPMRLRTHPESAKR